MTEIEQYAVSLVHEGAAHCAQDDMGEDADNLTGQQWREACDLGRKMAQAIDDNPGYFLSWFRSIGIEQVNA